MENNRLFFKKPPLIEARTEVAFKNMLEVADFRSRFYDSVKQDFPIVLIPDKSKLTYDFGDYSLNTENWSYRLEIGMNYFRLFSGSYSGFADFKERFRNSLSRFAECYGIKSFTQFIMQYNNRLPLDQFSFEDCFSIEVTIAKKLQPLFAGRGVMILDQPEGYVSIEIAPQLEGDKVTSYDLLLGFFSQRELAYEETANSIDTLLDRAHGYIEDHFISVLDSKYLEHLKSL
jgi:uncharacterized protein (TIGR04255 family)